MPQAPRSRGIPGSQMAPPPSNSANACLLPAPVRAASSLGGKGRTLDAGSTPIEGPEPLQRLSRPPLIFLCPENGVFMQTQQPCETGTCPPSRPPQTLGPQSRGRGCLWSQPPGLWGPSQQPRQANAPNSRLHEERVLWVWAMFANHRARQLLFTHEETDTCEYQQDTHTGRDTRAVQVSSHDIRKRDIC